MAEGLEGLPPAAYTDRMPPASSLPGDPPLWSPDEPEGRVVRGDALHVLREVPDGVFRCCVTSPPYWGLRDYGVDYQVGAEAKLGHYLHNLTLIFREVRRTLTDDGTLWLNIGDSYTSGGRTWRDTDRKNPARAMSYRPPTPDGLKPKDLIGVPWRVAFALQADGWYLRSDIVWYKPNCQPESVKDRPTRAHEYIFLLSKSERYYYDQEAIREQANAGERLRNRRSVWAVNTEAYPEAHFATFPAALIEPCLRAGAQPGDWVLDPFLGSGTVAAVCLSTQRRYYGIEINPEYVALAEQRLAGERRQHGRPLFGVALR
jgi:site-specific DNA-methyltransferase (cytosine-N4-specific)